MLDLAVNGYSESDTIKALHAKSGTREIKFKFELLNRYDIKIGEFEALESGNSINFDSMTDIKRTAQFKFKENELQDVDWLNDRVRPVFYLKMPDENYAEWQQGIFIMSSPTRKYDFGIWREIEAYDTSLILKEDKFTNRYFIPANTKYTDAITSIVNSAGIVKVNITASTATLGTDKEFEIGTTKLDAVNQLLTEINYTSIWVDNNGYFISKPYILPMERDADYSYKTDSLSVIYDNAVNSLDLFNVPNSWVVTASNPEKTALVSTYTNSELTSKTSTVNRGRTIVDYQKIDDIFDQSTLDAYTKRLAYNASQVYETLNFETWCMPHHSFQDVLFVEYKNLNISSKYLETSWQMELAAGGKMQHSARRVINI